jgi:hypothetical protein
MIVFVTRSPLSDNTFLAIVQQAHLCTCAMGGNEKLQSRPDEHKVNAIIKMVRFKSVIIPFFPVPLISLLS